MKEYLKADLMVERKEQNSVYVLAGKKADNLVANLVYHLVELKVYWMVCLLAEM
jgi:hypothetical protein